MATAGATIRAADFPASQADVQSASGTTTSASYTPTLTGGTACGVAFVAPTSGVVLVFNTAQFSNSGANNTRCSFFVRTGSSIGSGTTVLASDDGRALLQATTAAMCFSRVHPVTGLTPGNTYNVQQEFKVAAGTGTFSNKNIVVIPCT